MPAIITKRAAGLPATCNGGAAARSHYQEVGEVRLKTQPIAMKIAAHNSKLAETAKANVHTAGQRRSR
jgi:hypothetical protein